MNKQAYLETNATIDCKSMPIDTFRIALASDVENIVTLVNQAYRPVGSTAGWTHEAHLLSGFRTDANLVHALMSETDSVILLTCKHELIVSCVHIKKNGHQCSIGMLAVCPSAQGNDIGKRILAYAEQYAAKKFAAEKFVMVVLSARSELIDFYLRRGYQKTGVVKDYPVSAGVGTPRLQNLTLEVLEKTNNTMFSLSANNDELYTAINTERLLLRSPCVADACKLAKLVTPSVSRWLASWPEPMSEPMAVHKIISAREEIITNLALHFLVERLSDNTLIGWIKISRAQQNPRIGDLSYWLNETYHGFGYATEALLTVLMTTFSHLDLDSIEAGAQLENAASFAVMRKLGMSACGQRAVWASTRNRVEDCNFYSVSRAKYMGLPQHL